jgi:Hexapeptide repeat of succinyl-transferase
MGMIIKSKGHYCTVLLFGPAVQIYAATHPLSAAERRRGLESGRAVEVGDEVWVGGGAIICPGVRVGARSVIGAGSVVTRDIPEGVLILEYTLITRWQPQRSSSKSLFIPQY